MKRQDARAASLGLALVCAACGAGGPRVLERGVLAYDVAAAGELVATLELGTEFALVLRRGGRLTRVALGPAEHDMVDVAVDGAGKVVAVAGKDGTVRLHDGLSGAERGRWRLDDAATSVALSGDGQWLVHGAASGVLCLRRAADGALLQCVAEHTAAVRALAIAGDELASGDDAGRLVLWELPSLRLRSRWETGRAVTAVAVSAAGRVAAGHAPLVALAFAGEELVSAGRDGQIVRGDRPIARFPGLPRGLAVAGRELYVAGFTSRDLMGPSLLVISL